MDPKRLVRSVLRRMNKRTPIWPPMPSVHEIIAACSYRAKNGRHVQEFISQLPPTADIRLHALDDVPEALTRFTVSQGALPRMDALGRLLPLSSIGRGSWVVLFDDDATFSSPGRSRFVDIAAGAGLDIAGAAIDVGQPRTFNHSEVRAFSFARTVRLVEVGPIVAFSPRAIARVLPFPQQSGMGWGLDIHWAHLEGLRLGYVDATPIHHHGAVGASYETGLEHQRAMDAATAVGLETVYDLVGSLERWSAWRRTPPWLADQVTPRVGQ